MVTITTSNAATQAGVTVDTIRTWCRTGAVAAIKQAGRWIIDAASLAYRIALPKLLHRPRPVVFTVDTMLAIGGNRWQRNGHDRIYLNNWAELAGLDVSHYKSGNINGATWQGEGISNSQARLILGSLDKVWFDTADNQVHCRFGWTKSRVATPDEIWQAALAGIRAAIAAL
ncbi:hypothetical protein ACFVFS_17210 [Kitasatospora sp. NPDC057692]|uniref:hypothetical protein n=1 Tax=Kitasatospora sp. NPDC057692 TaxID=3346215 RepID=UPI00367E8BC7